MINEQTINEYLLCPSSLGILNSTMAEEQVKNTHENEQDEQDQDQKKKRRRRKKTKTRRLVMSIVTVCFAGILVAFFSTRLTNYVNAIPEVQVPDVVGMEESDAVEVLRMHKLDAIMKGERASEEVSPNRVLETYPEPGSKVKIGRAVRYILSMGKGQMYLQDLRGLSLEQAQEAMAEKGLTIEEGNPEYSVSYKEGIILRQEPTPNTYIKPDSSIKVNLSKGFPVEFTIESIEQGYDKQKVKLKLITIGDEESKTDIKVVVIRPGLSDDQEIRFHDHVDSGKEVTLEFDEEIGSRIEVYYDDILAKAGKVLFD